VVARRRQSAQDGGTRNRRQGTIPEMTATDEQKARWNGAAGEVWVENRDLLDATFRPFETILCDAVRTAGARSVLDVGCGTGSTTLAIARTVGPDGTVLGADISEPMIAAARERAAAEGSAARFVVADVETHGFPPGAFDAIVSRFGVMFFSDPARAFANLHGAAREGAVTALIAWRSAADNPFMTAAERAAAPFLPELPPRQPGPGQFAFGDAAYVERILADAGWRDVAITPLDVDCAFPAAALDHYVTRMGPIGMALREMDPAIRARIVDAVRAAFVPYVAGDEVRFTAACWMIRGRA
jgi:SAM-dependent methyltransferase